MYITILAEFWPNATIIWVAQGGHSGIQVTESCEWGHKLNPPQVPWAWSETQKNPLDQNKLKPPKKSWNCEFQIQKNPLHLPVNWNLEYPPPGMGDIVSLNFQLFSYYNYADKETKEKTCYLSDHEEP